MKKLITSLFVMLAVSFSIQAQVAWNNIRVTPYPYTQHIIAGADTVYFSMLNRSTGRAIGVLPNDSLTGLANDVNYVAADSLVWRIIKGASVGTSPRVRFINLKTGKYLYVGTKGGTTKRPYMSTNVDPFNGEKDFSLTDKGQRVNAEYYYNIVDYQGSILNNLSATATIGIGAASNTGTATYMFRFYSKKGPLPKADLMPVPTVEISTTQTVLTVGGDVVLNVKVTKGANDLLGTTKLYIGATLVATLSLNSNGETTYTYSGLAKGAVTFTAVYSGDANYGPNDAGAAFTVVPDPTAKSTVAQLSAPATSEVYKDVKMDISVKTTANEIVPKGYALLYVNNVIKNRIIIDSLGNGSVTLPNLLVGNEKIKAIYIGDEHYYLNSDSAKISIDITPSTATVKPYPVYFDLCDQPEFKAWERETGTARPFTHAFRMDSLAGIVISDTITQAFKVSYQALGGTYDKIDNCYNRADIITVPLGSDRPTWVKFKTPWLNAGSYNIYISHRVNSDLVTHMSSITMDDKELYYPNEEMFGRWFRSWGASNMKRQWNAKAHSGSMGMNYIGSVSVSNSSAHSLKINVLPENGGTYSLDMLQFIPVDMDSLSINLPAATSMAKKYYPMFDWLGFARQADFLAANVPATYTTKEQFAVPYQVQDQTNWGDLISHTIDSVGIIARTINGSDYVANYVTVYRAEDRWTRVSEGYGDATNLNYICSLPKGHYYYEAILFTDNNDGAQGYRTFINNGYFTVGNPDAVSTPTTSNIKAFANGNTLTVRGIKAGARILVTDLTGKMIVNTVSTSDIFTKALYPSIYVVKVVSDNDILRTKVIVK